MKSKDNLKDYKQLILNILGTVLIPAMNKLADEIAVQSIEKLYFDGKSKKRLKSLIIKK
jgi:hypothetical protein